MKICYFIHCYPPAIGGLEFLSKEIVDIFEKDGNEVFIITGNGKTLDSYKTMDNWIDNSNGNLSKNIFRLKLKENIQKVTNKLFNKIIFKSGSFSSWYFGPILEYNSKSINAIKSCDLIIGAGLPTKMVWDAYKFSKKYNKPLITIPAYHNVSYYNKSYIFKKVFKRSKKIICLSKFEENDLKKNYPSVKNKTEVVVFSPYDKKSLKSIKKNKNINRLNHLLKKNITIGYVGQITTRKNLKFFKELLNSDDFKDNFSDWNINLLLAGSMTNSSEIVENQLSSLSNVNFIYNFKSKSNVFNKIDIFINPSSEESLGIVNFEAMYYQIPIFFPKINPFISFLPDQSYDNSSNLSYFIKKIVSSKKNYLGYIDNQNNILSNYSKDIFSDRLIELIS